MKLPRILFFPLILLASACSHAIPSASPTYRAELEKAFREKVAFASTRMPAKAHGARSSRWKMANWKSAQPGRFRVFVFPRISALNAKNNEHYAPLYRSEADEETSLLGPPEEFEVSNLALSPCYQFLEKGLFAKYHPQAFFPPALAQDRTRQCAILEITALKVKNADKALIRRDDLLRARLFLDDNFVTYGYELDKYQSSRALGTVQLKIDGNLSASSGLSLLPIDIPSMNLLASSLARAGEFNSAARIDKLAIAQIRRKLMKNFSPETCRGRVVAYRDVYGANVEVGWCDGAAFPQYMSNPRFVAITQPLH